MSAMPSSGLVGVSTQTIFVRPGCTAARTASGSETLAGVNSRPQRWATRAKSRYVPPYASSGITTWSPGWHTARSRVSSAARPLAKASPTGPPSSAARHSWSASRVGLPERLYS